MSTPSQPVIVVVGSLHYDIMVDAPDRPRKGETVAGHAWRPKFGGKGGNQAIAAARLGADVAILGRVGEDPFGRELVVNLRDNGVDTSRVEAVTHVPTGSAFITVTPDGENAIVVSPGANRRFGPAEVRAASEDLRKARLLLAQLEVEVEAVEMAAYIVAGNGGRFLLTLAPPR